MVQGWGRYIQYILVLLSCRVICLAYRLFSVILTTPRIHSVICLKTFYEIYSICYIFNHVSLQSKMCGVKCNVFNTNFFILSLASFLYIKKKVSVSGPFFEKRHHKLYACYIHLWNSKYKAIMTSLNKSSAYNQNKIISIQ